MRIFLLGASAIGFADTPSALAFRRAGRTSIRLAIFFGGRIDARGRDVYRKLQATAGLEDIVWIIPHIDRMEGCLKALCEDCGANKHSDSVRDGHRFESEWREYRHEAFDGIASTDR